MSSGRVPCSGPPHYGADVVHFLSCFKFCLQAGALSDHLLPEVEAGDEDELEDDLVVEQAKHLLPVSARAPTLLRLDKKLARHLNE